jgi:hypothetical protein
MRPTLPPVRTAPWLMNRLLIDTSATREIYRVDDTSQSIERIWTHLARGTLFMPQMPPVYTAFSRHYFHYGCPLDLANDLYPAKQYKTYRLLLPRALGHMLGFPDRTAIRLNHENPL